MNLQKKRLLVLTHSYYPAIGGVETFVEHLLTKLDADCYEIKVFTSDKNLKGKTPQYEHRGIKVEIIRSFGIGGLLFPASARDFIRFVKECKNAHIVHQHDIKFLSSTLSLLSFFFPFRLFLFSHGYFYHSTRFLFIKKMYLRYFAMLSSRYRKIINVSASDFEVARKYRFKNSILVKEAVDLATFASVANNEQKDRWLYFGRIAENKGLANLFQCLASLPRKEFCMVVLGNGEPAYIARLKDFCSLHGIDRNIVWLHGATSAELLEEVSKAEIIFLPSVYEGFGISLLESIASRTKIMAHPNDGYKAILKDIGREDALFDFTEPKFFEEKIEMIRNRVMEISPDLSQYDHDTMVKKIEELANDKTL